MRKEIVYKTDSFEDIYAFIVSWAVKMSSILVADSTH